MLSLKNSIFFIYLVAVMASNKGNVLTFLYPKRIHFHGIVIVLFVPGNFFRIRSAFAFGAKRLARLLDCPKDRLNFEVNQFFTNTWERHGSGHRPDAPGVDSWRMKLSTLDTPLEIRNSIDGTGGKKVKGRSNAHGLDVHAHGASRSQSLKSQFATHSVNDTEGRLLFARTHSSPELTDNHNDASSQVQRSRQGETGDARATYSRSDDSNGVPNNYAFSEEFTTTSGAQLMHQEDQDIVNMMASASLHGFNGQVHVPYNLASGHLPYSIPPSLLASMGYSQRNFPGFVPANLPMMDPSFSHLQFSRNLVPPHLAHCFPGIGLNPSEDLVDQSNENLSPMESVGANNDCWQEQDSGSSGRYDLENGNLDTVHSEEKPPASLKYIPPQSRIAASAGARVPLKHPREKHGAVRDNADSSLVQDMNVDEVHGEEKSGSSRFSSAAHGNSLRSRTSSESSWDGSSVKALKSTKEKRGKKIPTDLIVSTGKEKVMSEHAMNEVDDDQEWGSLSNMGIEIIERNHMPEFEVAQTSGSDSMMPFAPVLINPGPRHGTNDSSGVIAFYPTGPPIPFLTMLPFYNVPPEAGTSDASSGHFGGHEAQHDNESVMNLNRKGFDQPEEFSSSTSSIGMSANEASKNRKADILNSDFVSHWQSLQFGRVCQNPRYQGPSAAFPSPVMVPPVYVQGRVPYDNPARPITTNSNLLSQLVTSYGNHLVPVAPPQSASGRFPNVYPSYMDDVPRYRSGTGTYLPNPVSTVS